MNPLPIEEMLLDLQTALEELQNNQNYDSLDKVFEQTQRIDRTCEDLFGDEE